MEKKNKIIYILSALIIVVAAFFVYRNYFLEKINIKDQPVQSVAKNDNLAVFSFSPETISVSAGKEFTIDVLIDPKSHDVSNADLVFYYDNKKMKLNSINHSDKFTQVLASDISKENKATHSASTDFGSNIDSETVYATLHFLAIEKIEKTRIEIDKESSGIYADNNPGVNIVQFKSNAIISITD